MPKSDSLEWGMEAPYAASVGLVRSAMSSVASASDPEMWEAASCPGKDETDPVFSKVLPEEAEPYLALECVGKRDEPERSSCTL